MKLSIFEFTVSLAPLMACNHKKNLSTSAMSTCFDAWGKVSFGGPYKILQAGPSSHIPSNGHKKDACKAAARGSITCEMSVSMDVRLFSRSVKIFVGRAL